MCLGVDVTERVVYPRIDGVTERVVYLGVGFTERMTELEAKTD